jgi:23S rRNA pseudouridine1911/1915/1917 synthase
VVEEREAGHTLAAAVRRRAPTGTSWNEVRDAIRLGKVTVAGDRALDPARRVAPGESVELVPHARRIRAAQAGPRVRIVFEDADVVVIDKPSGVSSVPFEKREGGTAMDLVRAEWRLAGRAHASSQPLLVVHRIDKDTSGLLVYAKNKRAERGLAGQFRAHTAARTYLCIAHGKVTSARIESRLMRDRGDGLRGSARHANQPGKRAVTHVEALDSVGQVATRCRVRLETGKTHQIRIHLAESGHPIVGERVYTRDFEQRGGVLLASPRLLLHAATLGFTHPRTEKTVAFESPLPPDFAAAALALE